MKIQTTTTDLEHDDITMIIPATGWFARFECDDGEEATPLVAWGLTRGGDVVGLDADSGWVDVCKEVSNFVGYAFKPDVGGHGSVASAILRSLSRLGKRIRQAAAQHVRGGDATCGSDRHRATTTE